MEITDDLIDRLAQLSKLDFDAETREHMKHDFQRMLDFVDVLRELDTEGVKPLIHMTEAVNELRPDEPKPALNRAEMLAQAKGTTESFFSVPKVVNKGS